MASRIHPVEMVVTVKVAIVVVGVLVASMSQLVFMLSRSLGDDPTSLGALIPAGALTATSGALVYVVKLITSGKLVHRDPAHETAALAVAVKRSNDLAAAGHKREERLELLMAQIMQLLAARGS